MTQGRTEKWTRDLRTEAPLVLALVWKFLKARLGFEKGRRVGRGAAGAASDEDSCCQGDAPAVTSLLVACSLAQAWGGRGNPCFRQFQPQACTPEQGPGTPCVSHWGGGAPYSRPRWAPGPVRSQAQGEGCVSRLQVTPGRGGGPDGDLWLIIKPSPAPSTCPSQPRFDFCLKLRGVEPPGAAALC